jgi:hypothetical protein
VHLDLKRMAAMTTDQGVIKTGNETKKNPRSPVGVGIFGIFGILSSSNPPSGIFGFYPGKGSAYSP